MHHLSDNYYLREYYLKSDQVPTQSLIKQKMHTPLANVCLKYLKPRVKVLVGLEPPMKGGGSEWCTLPEDLLAGRNVLKPINKMHLKRLSSEGIWDILEKHNGTVLRAMLQEQKNALLESDNKGRSNTYHSSMEIYQKKCTEKVAEFHNELLEFCNQFETLYRTSITKIEDLMRQTAVKEIERVRDEASQYMEHRYEELVTSQETKLHEEYDMMLINIKAAMKADFIKEVEQVRTEAGNQIHDLQFEKYVTVEKLRHYVECQNLACQIYVAFKEKEEYDERMKMCKVEHRKKVDDLKEKIVKRDFQIRSEIEQQSRCKQLDQIWKKKICHVIRHFQQFIEYCLTQLPEHAEVFIKMEKLMLLHMNEAIEKPSIESIIECKTECTPRRHPHLFYLFCDKGYMPQIDENLCRKYNSSATLIPVVVINKRCIYSGCDTFDRCADEVTAYIEGNRGDDLSMNGSESYCIPIKYTASLHLRELKLESSLMQVVQKELPNLRGIPMECGYCKMTNCLCCEFPSKISVEMSRKTSDEHLQTQTQYAKELNTRRAELQFLREPKLESYADYILLKSFKTAKTHFRERLPPYMRHMSPYEPPDLPNYKICNLQTLRTLVKRAKDRSTPSSSSDSQMEKHNKDAWTQYSDQEFDRLCICLSEEAVDQILEDLTNGSFESNVGGSVVDSSARTRSSFATVRAPYFWMLSDMTSTDTKI